jgi:phosphopantothenoylcysteine decarboxylase/phosphopantothenate--cysteine ligase
MNVRMWNHPATQRNLAALRLDGIAIVGPNHGEMACGEFGPGRMAEPAEIFSSVVTMLQPRARPLAGKRVLITAGPTREPIDPVRFISNHSSGKQGYAIAEAAAALGAETILVSGPVSLAIPAGVQMVPVETAEEMRAACEQELPVDIAVFSAAVADWRVSTVSAQKMKKLAGSPRVLELAENPDILKTIATRATGRPQIVIGFAAETEEVVRHGTEKLSRKNCDLIVANDVSSELGVFGGDHNKVHLISRTGIENWPDMSKREVARKLMERAAGMLSPTGGSRDE